MLQQRKNTLDWPYCCNFRMPWWQGFLTDEDLGLIAGKNSQVCLYIVTDDHGGEPFENISNDIAKFVESTGCPYKIIEDRGRL